MFSIGLRGFTSSRVVLKRIQDLLLIEDMDTLEGSFTNKDGDQSKPSPDVEEENVLIRNLEDSGHKLNSNEDPVVFKGFVGKWKTDTPPVLDNINLSLKP